jgi:L-cysteine:1D-myo-inositol 2-amino-2-deoxy-alpha-D-glucopyranoside ligase
MRSWDSVRVPVIRGGGSGRVSIHDSARGAVVPVGPERGEARLYACGITPYDATHLGHAFTYVAVDLLVRAWRDAGLDVRYAQNVTDVDDPLLERAAATGQEWTRLAAEQVELYRNDMAALRVLPPRELTAVSDVIGDIAATLADLRDRQAVYQLDDPEYPDWYFSVADEDALLAGTPVTADDATEVFAERGGDPDRPGKHHPLDCLVWRQHRPGEPAWDTWLGRGRPGWHIGCTTIALRVLGADFDVQAGGSDLAFPHHPMSAAEAGVLTGEPFADAFLHSGMVSYDGAKMSKSLGNLVFVHRLLADGADPMAIRLVLLAHHYRSDWEYTSAELDAATKRLGRWRAAVGTRTGAGAAATISAVRAALRHDLDSPAAVAAVDAWAEAGGDDSSAPGDVRDAVDALLGIAL